MRRVKCAGGDARGRVGQYLVEIISPPGSGMS